MRPQGRLPSAPSWREEWIALREADVAAGGIEGCLPPAWQKTPCRTVGAALFSTCVEDVIPQARVSDRPSVGEPPADQGLRCPSCDYNLTGITSERCPECGHVLQWDAIRRERTLEENRPGTHWERYAGIRRPVGFVVTALRAALFPWLFAQEVPARPALRAAVAFLAVCLALGMLGAVIADNADGESLVMWGIGVVCQVLLQTLLFGLLLPPGGLKYAFRFWLGTSAYTSYPLLLEGFRSPPYILCEYSNIWPFSAWGGETADLLTSILYHLWWAGLVVIAAMRLHRRRRRRILLVLVAIPLLTYLSSYAGCYLGDLVF